MLSVRGEAILKSIVGQYITQAIPVPSQSIRNNPELGVSSATIRNEMAHLEQEGYITRSHPSAGSIPSDKGYRHYVDSLGHIKLPLAEQRLVSHLFHQVEEELDKWLNLAATVIAQMAQNVAVVAKSKSVANHFKHLELVSLQDCIALVVLVLGGAKVKQQLITFDQTIFQPELTVMANKLSVAYAGLTGSQIIAKGALLSPTEQLITNYLVKMMGTKEENEYEEHSLDGLHFMLNHPEFARNQRLLSLMELIEQRRLLKTITPAVPTGNRVQVIIGRENTTEAFYGYSVVIKQYGLPQKALGTIGVIGPTRMPYAHTIAAVDYLSSVLSELVARLYGRETPAG